MWAKAKGLLGLGGGEEGGMDAQERLQITLCELHSLIYQQVEAEVRDFWGSLEQSTNARQRQLFAALNARIAELSAAVEAEVSLTLDCQLEPVDMRLRTPSAEDFHCSLQELLERGIQRQVTVEECEGTTAVPVFVKRQRGPGLCSPAQEWWEPVTEERTGPVRVERVTYAPDLEAIRRYFVGIIDSTTQNSVRAVRHYVRAYLAERLEEARGVLQAYADQFTAAMNDSLEVARQGEAERSSALGVAEAHSAAAAAMLERVWELQRQAEQMLEGWGMEPEEEKEEGVEGCEESADEAAAGAHGPGIGSLLGELELPVGRGQEGGCASDNGSEGPPGLVEDGESEGEAAPAAAPGSSASIDPSGSENGGPPPLEVGSPLSSPERSSSRSSMLQSEPCSLPIEQMTAMLQHADFIFRPGTLEGEEAAEQLPLLQGRDDEQDEALPALAGACSARSEGSAASVPDLEAGSMYSADSSASTPPVLADSMLSYNSSCDGPAPLLEDSMCSAAGKASPALEAAGPAGADLSSGTAARSSSRAAQAAAAYQAAETARLAAALLATDDGEEGATAEVPLQEDRNSLEAEAEAPGGSAAEGGSGDDDWTVVSAASGEEEQGQPDDEQVQASPQPADPAAA